MPCPLRLPQDFFSIPCREGWKSADLARYAAPGFGLIQNLGQTAELNRLGKIAVHSGGETAFLVALHGMRGQRNDPLAPARGPFPFPDRGGRLETVHFGHLHVHQHKVEVLPGKDRQCLSPVPGHHCRMTAFFQNAAKELLIGRVVLDNQDVESPAARLGASGTEIRGHRSGLGPLSGNAKPGREVETTTVVRLAFHPDPSPQHAHQARGNGKSQTGTAE